ncbi:MAG: Dabb family protein [Opitutaceae bacterium]|jgi:hypothetical protein
MLVHSVYFHLVPGLSPAQRAEFRQAVEILRTISCVEKAFVGAPAAVPDRPVIEKGYGLALTVIFKDVAAHNSYQVDPIHLAFVAKYKHCWTRVQVYDVQE